MSYGHTQNSMIRLILLLFFLLFSLEYESKLTAKILRINEAKNQLLLDVGSSDGLEFQDVAKIYHLGQFMGEAVCLQVLPYSSQWVLHYSYRKMELPFLENQSIELINPYRPGKKIFIKGLESYSPL